MSGHSKWSTIRHKKALNDAKKGKVFSKMAQLITVAAMQGGADLSANPTLRLLVNKAKSESMPVANIERAIARGAGTSDEKVVYENLTYEGLIMGDCGVMIDVLTDNKNRTVSEIRQIFNEAGGILAQTGAVSWNFETRGLIVLKCAKKVKSQKFGQDDTEQLYNKDDVVMEMMEIDGVKDIIEDRSIFIGHSGQGGEEQDIEIYTDFEDLASVRDKIEKTGYIIKESIVVRLCKTHKDYSDEQIEKIAQFCERLMENDDVQLVWSDADRGKFMSAMYEQ